MAHIFTKQVAEYLANHHNTVARADIAAGLEYAYRPKRNSDGSYCVWCDGSDHYVDFDQLGIANTGLRNITETTMMEAHKAGMAYWRNNRPADATQSDLRSLAQSCGWYGEDNDSWLAGFYGQKKRDQ